MYFCRNKYDITIEIPEIVDVKEFKEKE